MAKAIRRLNGPGLALLILLLPAIVSSPGSRAQAQTGGQRPEGMIIHPDGVIDVKQLPPTGLEAPVDRAIPRKFPHPELLRQKKEEMRHERPKSRQLPDSALQLEPAPSSGPSIATSFIGLRKSESGSFIPPDTQVAAGPNHIFEVVNTEGRIFMKDGTVISTFNLNTFFGVSKSTFLSDPKIRFDLMTGRWFVLAITLGNTSGSWRLAVSTSSDPTGSFFLYNIILPTLPSPIGPDFPAIGFNDDKVTLTANAFDCVPTCVSGSTFLGTMFLVLNKAELLAGGPVHFTFFAPDQGLNTIQPAHSFSSTSTLFMAAVASLSTTSIRIWSVTGVPDGVGGVATFTTVNRSINTLSTPPNAMQMGTSNLIVTNDNDLLDAVFRDGSLWVAANSACTPSWDTMTRACLRFIEVLTGTLTKNQDFDFGTNETYYYYPAIQTDSANNLITVFSRSSSSEFASVYASGRLTSDTLNTLQAPVLVKAGEAPYGADRWGDYSGAGIDPSDLASVWVAGEYTRTEGGSEWGTWIAQISLGAPGFTLSAIKAGDGTGTVTLTPPGSTCGTLCAGSFESYATNTVVTLGAVADAGVFFMGFTGDPDCTNGQVTMDANKTCTATFINLPDLTGQIVSLTRTPGNGKDKLTFTLIIQNVGTATPTGSLVVQFFLSDNMSLDLGDMLLLTKTIKGKKLPPGGMVSVKGKATVPSPSQGKFIIANIDATNAITELDEGNNLATQSIP